MQALVSLVAAIVSGEASDAVARARRAALVYALAGLFVLVGATFLLVAGFIAAAREIGAFPAALWFGGGFVVLALLLVGIDRLAASSRAKREAKRRREEARAIASAAAVAILPTLLASRARGFALIFPAAAALAYGVWRENAPRSRDDDPR
ncbi:MAG: hypothetical protein M9945_19095 [Aquamicrobium sp.]|uniref:hypothetical protein n=1 Tax=Aquamicrobium sp. TaxID=1872579 RepID=UPI00349ED5A9|nr:hypothetical protein [Aquamicrobium sp.]